MIGFNLYSCFLRVFFNSPIKYEQLLYGSVWPIHGWLVGWLVGFYGISTLVGYLTPNSVYMYIHSTKDLVGKFFYKQDFTCLHMINQFQFIIFFGTTLSLSRKTELTITWDSNKYYYCKSRWQNSLWWSLWLMCKNNTNKYVINQSETGLLCYLDFCDAVI